MPSGLVRQTFNSATSAKHMIPTINIMHIPRHPRSFEDIECRELSPDLLKANVRRMEQMPSTLARQNAMLARMDIL
jgi:hypothetical protein